MHLIQHKVITFILLTSFIAGKSRFKKPRFVFLNRILFDLRKFYAANRKKTGTEKNVDEFAI